MRRRFFVEQFAADQARLVGEAAHHLGKVLRAQPGQIYELSDGEKVRLGTIERVERDSIAFALGEEIPAHMPRLRMALLLAIVKFDRFEWALEKATELGVAEVVPLLAERSEKGLIAATAKRSERWNKIVLESAQQARRLKPPQVAAPAKVADALRNARAGIRLFLSEQKQAQPLRNVLPGMKEYEAELAVTVAIGPEGGWTQSELQDALAGGFVEASLGQNILRTETAVIATIAALQYALGD